MPSITGQQDHTPFGSRMAELVYGRRPDGSLVSIDEVESGRKCDCVCPACGVPLIAQKGDRNVHHFRHDGTEVGCGRGGETSAHIWAKLTLEKNLQINVPEIGFRDGAKWVVLHPARVMRFASAELEKRDGDIVPDVVVTTKSGRRLIVEIHVTHKCSPEKKAILAQQGTAAIEIDLSKLRTCQDEGRVALALIGATAAQAAHRIWLYNPKLADDIDAYRAAKKLEADKKTKARLDEARAFVTTAKANTTSPGDDWALAAIRRHDALGLLDDGDEPLPGFTVTARDWQALIFHHVILRKMDVQWGGQRHFSLGEAKACVSDYVIPAFRKPAEDRVVAVREVAPDFIFPGEAVTAFIERLLNAGILAKRYWGDGLELSSAGVDYLAKGKSRIERGHSLRSDAKAIVDRIPIEERQGFDFDAWLATPHAGSNATLNEIATEGGERWLAIERALQAIKAMQADGDATAMLIGLPLEATRLRAIARAEAADQTAQLAKAQAEAQARRNRGTAISNRAETLLGIAQARAWLGASYVDTAQTRLTIAEESDTGYHAISTQMEQYARELAETQRLARQKADALKALEAEANAVWDTSVARWWLDHHDHRLGAIPTVYCVDPTTLQRCRALLPSARGTKRRRS